MTDRHSSSVVRSMIRAVGPVLCAASSLAATAPAASAATLAELEQRCTDAGRPALTVRAADTPIPASWYRLHSVEMCDAFEAVRRDVRKDLRDGVDQAFCSLARDVADEYGGDLDIAFDETLAFGNRIHDRGGMSPSEEKAVNRTLKALDVCRSPSSVAEMTRTLISRFEYGLHSVGTFEQDGRRCGGYLRRVTGPEGDRYFFGALGDCSTPRIEARAFHPEHRPYGAPAGDLVRDELDYDGALPTMTRYGKRTYRYTASSDPGTELEPQAIGSDEPESGTMLDVSRRSLPFDAPFGRVAILDNRDPRAGGGRNCPRGSSSGPFEDTLLVDGLTTSLGDGFVEPRTLVRLDGRWLMLVEHHQGAACGNAYEYPGELTVVVVPDIGSVFLVELDEFEREHADLDRDLSLSVRGDTLSVELAGVGTYRIGPESGVFVELSERHWRLTHAAARADLLEGHARRTESRAAVDLRLDGWAGEAAPQVAVLSGRLGAVIEPEASSEKSAFFLLLDAPLENGGCRRVTALELPRNIVSSTSAGERISVAGTLGCWGPGAGRYTEEPRLRRARLVDPASPPFLDSIAGEYDCRTSNADGTTSTDRYAFMGGRDLHVEGEDYAVSGRWKRRGEDLELTFESLRRDGKWIDVDARTTATLFGTGVGTLDFEIVDAASAEARLVGCTASAPTATMQMRRAKARAPVEDSPLERDEVVRVSRSPGSMMSAVSYRTDE